MKPVKFSVPERLIIFQLFDQVYLRKSIRSNGECFVVYDYKKNPLWKVETDLVTKLQQLNLLKKDTKGRYTISLKAVRSFNRNHFIKKHYKQIKTTKK